MNSAFSFARLFLTRPEQAAEACRAPRALRDGLVVYAASAAASLVVAWVDPLSLLDPSLPLPAVHELGFWLRVALWEPVVSALNVFLFIVVLDWMRTGWLPVKTAAATFWAAVPLILWASAASADRSVDRAPFSPALFLLVLAAWIVPAVALARRLPRQRWRETAAFLLGLNAIQVVGIAVETALVLVLRSKNVFIAWNVVVLLWMLVVVGRGLRRLCDMSPARVVLAFLFSVLLGSTVPEVAYLAGLLPMEVLKVLVYV